MKFPKAIEIALLRMIRGRLRAIREFLGLPADPQHVFAVRQSLQSIPPDLTALERLALRLDNYATNQVARTVGRLAAIDVTAARTLAGRQDLQAVHRRWARENAALITSVEERYLDDVARAVQATVTEGRTDLDKVLTERFGVADSNAKRVARTEVAKLNSQITQNRQLALGITHYRWVSAHDERVRPSHRDLNGTVRAWNDPHPTEGHPGEAVNCRCIAEPILPDDPILDTIQGPAP